MRLIFFLFQADVTGAYDTIPHEKLVEVVSQILAPEKRTVYCIRRYAMIKITMNGQIRKYYRRQVWLVDFFLLLTFFCIGTYLFSSFLNNKPQLNYLVTTYMDILKKRTKPTTTLHMRNLLVETRPISPGFPTVILLSPSSEHLCNVSSKGSLSYSLY